MMTNPEERVRLHALISGRVQGVGFRDFALRNALSLNLVGWVRNTFAGNVEVLAESDRRGLEAFVELLKQGPRAAVVAEVQVDWQAASNEFHQFFVARDSE